MSNRHNTKKHKETFYDLDIFKLPVQDSPHILFFEKNKAVMVDRQQDSIKTTINSCEILVKRNISFSHDQFILMDLFSKGIYYENISNYSNFFNFFRTLRSAREDIVKKCHEFALVLRDAIDGKIAKIEILPDGNITSSPPETLTKDEINNI